MYAMTGLYSEQNLDSSLEDSNNSVVIEPKCNHKTNNLHSNDAVINCHSRQPSAAIDWENKAIPTSYHLTFEEYTNDCGILGCRPSGIQRFARIKVYTPYVLFVIYKVDIISTADFNNFIFIFSNFIFRYLCYFYRF